MIEILQPYFDTTITNKIIYPVKINGNLYDFYMHYENENDKKMDLNLNIDGIVVMLSSIAICNKWKITSTLPIDEKLYNNLLKLPNTYKKYHSKHTSLLSMVSYDEIELILDLPTFNRENTIEKGLQCNITPISMGIDSLHTILSNLQEITHTIYINYMDVSTTVDNFHEVINYFSEKYNKSLIIANSNFKELLLLSNLPGTNYGVFMSDAILLASCYPLGLKKLYFSGFGNSNLPCLMSQHSDINKYFNSNEFTTCNNEIERIKKINYIVNNDVEMIKFLYVCNTYILNNTTNIVNCSKCRKCIITLLYFHMLGYIHLLNDTFVLPTEEELKHLMNTIHIGTNKALGTIYYDKIYEEYLKLYKNNNEEPLCEIIDNYCGKFVGEDYHLFSLT